MSDAAEEIRAIWEELYRTRGMSSGINSGATFPTGPTASMLFFRTDYNLLFVYDGAQWITTNEYSVVVGIDDNTATSFSATTSAARRGLLRDSLKPYLIRGEAFTFLAAGTSDGSNFWTVAFVDGNGTTVWSFVTSSDTAAANSAHSTNSFSQPSTAITTMKIDLTKTGSAPAITPRTPILFYRLVAT